MILVTADTHGEIEFRKLDNSRIKKDFGELPDYLIVAGDFGVPWSNDEENKTDLYMKKWYEGKSYDIIVIPGNHENYSRIEKMPREIYHGAWARRYGKNIVFVEKNQILELEDKKIYCFGGADSTDKEFRVMFESWWPQEQATYADFLQMEKLLKRLGRNNNPAVDYVITHTCPTKITRALYHKERRNDSTSKVLDYLDAHLEFKHWYFGHMHEDKTLQEKYTCVYDWIRELV